MIKDNVKLTWDGENIKQSVKVDDTKMSLKELIDIIDHATSEIDKMKEQKVQIKDNLNKLDEAIKSASEFKFDRIKFEDKAVEILTAKLHKYFEEGKQVWADEAISETDVIVAKDTNAYMPHQVDNQKYVLFQRKFATSKKVAENIPNRLIRELIFDKPFYDSPFK